MVILIALDYKKSGVTSCVKDLPFRCCASLTQEVTPDNKLNKSNKNSCNNELFTE